MSKKTEFTPDEWDRLNAILTKAIAAAYTDLCVTPYTLSKSKRKNDIKQHQTLSSAISKRHKNTGSRHNG